MKKVVIKLNSLDEKMVGISKIKQNPMQAVSSIQGIVSMEKNIKDIKITIKGEVDPVQIVKKLKKWNPKLDSVEPVKEEKKAPENDKKPEEPNEQEKMLMFAAQTLRTHYPHYTQYYHPVPTYEVHEENPNTCVIC